MEQKTVIITGASGNLGKAIVAYFLKENWRVIGLVHRVKNATDKNSKYIEIAVDLTDENSTESIIETIVEQYGNIHSAILTAGGFAMGNIAHTSIEDIKLQFNLNFVTAYNIARPVLKQMKLQYFGKIFFIGSGAGMDTRKGNGVTAYSLSKSLLFQLANIINAENKENEVQAQIIVPSIIDTPQNRADMPDADFSKWEKPEQIAAIVGKYIIQEKTKSATTAIIIQDEISV